MARLRRPVVVDRSLHAGSGFGKLFFFVTDILPPCSPRLTAGERAPHTVSRVRRSPSRFTVKQRPVELRPASLFPVATNDGWDFDWSFTDS
jgi:hypothetical protein